MQVVSSSRNLMMEMASFLSVIDQGRLSCSNNFFKTIVDSFQKRDPNGKIICLHKDLIRIKIPQINLRWNGIYVRLQVINKLKVELEAFNVTWSGRVYSVIKCCPKCVQHIVSLICCVFSSINVHLRKLDELEKLNKEIEQLRHEIQALKIDNSCIRDGKIYFIESYVKMLKEVKKNEEIEKFLTIELFADAKTKFDALPELDIGQLSPCIQWCYVRRNCDTPGLGHKLNILPECMSAPIMRGKDQNGTIFFAIRITNIERKEPDYRACQIFYRVNLKNKANLRKWGWMIHYRKFSRYDANFYWEACGELPSWSRRSSCLKQLITTGRVGKWMLV